MPEERTKMNPEVFIGEEAIDLKTFSAVIRGYSRVRVHPSAVPRIEQSREYLLREMKKGDPIYGVNTGFGLLSNVRISDEKIEKLQVNLIRSHATGVGDLLPDEQVAGMLFLRAVNLAQGYSGVRLELIELIVSLLNERIFPLIPEQGSVGASGDLAPLAHLALALIGEGKCRHRGKVVESRKAFQNAGLEPVALQAKEGLALINGTQFMTAIGAQTLLKAEQLIELTDAIACMSLEALRGTPAAFEKEIHAVRPHPGQQETARRIRSILLEQGRSEIAQSHEDCERVQDPYSLRCIPQVHGATRDTLRYVRSVLECEMNSVTDNPLIFADEQKILSGGNFHGQVVSMAMDYLAIALADLGSISEQRIEKLINPAISELPAFLTPESGINSGHMIVQVAAASIVSENKTLAHPASVDTIPTSADKEDHVSMGAWAARKANQVLKNTRRILSMELLCSTQGVDLLRPLKTTPTLERFHALIREKVPFSKEDRVYSEDIKAIESTLQEKRVETLLAQWRSLDHH